MSRKKNCSKNQRALKQVQNKQKAQRGRSMVEMLGVLAVMGILSVAGVAGYGITMDKYKATDLINDANVRAADVSAQIAAGNTPNLNGFDDDTFTGVELVGDKQFKLNVAGIKESVCNHMKTIVGTNGIIREIADDCSYLLYNNFLTAASGDGAAASDDSLWEPTLCSDNNDCGTCEQCMPWGECYKVETEECQCASNEMLVDMMGDGSMMSCIPCNYYYSFPAELTQNCETKCGQNRSIVEGLYSDPVCAMTRCPSGYFLDNYYECQSCNITDDIPVNSASDCSCSNRTFSAGRGGNNGGGGGDVITASVTAPAEPAGVCVLTSCMTGYFKSADNGCLSCNEPGEVYVYSEADCSCSNRRFVHAYEYSPVSEKAMADPNDGYCILDTCSSGHFKSKWDGCVACDELASYAVSSESDCSCTNRRFISDSSASVIIMIASGGGENEEGY
ncbi:MAG: type II secretion system protein, partial [Alphaproteobacteria bacterium]|nr:type II secretion system protein [Alphaproteobacteria bacterium]